MAAALLSIPDNLKNVPVYKIPTALLNDVAKVVNLTTLATVVIPAGTKDPLSTLLSTLGTTMPDLTINGIKVCCGFRNPSKDMCVLPWFFDPLALCSLYIPCGLYMDRF